MIELYHPITTQLGINEELSKSLPVVFTQGNEICKPTANGFVCRHKTLFSQMSPSVYIYHLCEKGPKWEDKISRLVQVFCL